MQGCGSSGLWLLSFQFFLEFLDLSFFVVPSLINIFRVFYPTMEKYTCFSSIYGTYMKIDQITDLLSIPEGMLRLQI